MQGSTLYPGLSRPRLGPARPRYRRHEPASQVRAALGDLPLVQQLQSAGQQAVQTLGSELGSRLSGSGLGPAPPAVTRAGETLRDLATEPHWGTRLFTSAVQRWTAALSDFISTSGAGNSQPTEQVQRALAQLRDMVQGLQLPQLTAPQLSGGDLRAYADSLGQSAHALEQAVAAALASGGNSASQLHLPNMPQFPASVALPASVTIPTAWTDLVAYVGIAGVVALVASAWPRGPPPPGGTGGGSGRGRGGVRSSSSSQLLSALDSQAGDYLPSSYDVGLIEAYFAAHPVLVARRGAQVAAEAAQLGAMLLLDRAQGKLEANSWQRAPQLRKILERLGPAYVKVAQAISTRVDILSPPYLLEIERLQDQVQPFDDALGLDMISAAYGRPLGDVFERLSPRAVAAASLGQVYRGVLRPEFGGHEVAIKVRRPRVLQSVALDLYIMRRVALYIRRFPQVRSDWAGIIDNWAEAFFAEMDYSLEAANARRFKRDVEEKNLTGIVVPEVYLATDEVLVTQWIEGEKLSESTAADVRELCNTLLSAYLTQLLETGFLHADPHPGNLLRTPDGKIAILDYGLMTTVPPDYSLALVEYIAHLSVGDYEAIVDDLVTLGFMKGGGDRSGLVEPLGVLLAQLTAGGGATNVNIELVMAKIEELANRYPFQIPPYFALIIRCFSVIEGIALRVDPRYAIVTECFPYLCRRLLTDNHPRARKALRELLFGASGGRGGQQVDLARLQRMVDGFGNYTVAGLTDTPTRRLPGAGPSRERDLEVALQDAAGPAAAAVVGPAAAAPAAAAGPVDVAGDTRPLLSPAAKEALLVLFSREGNHAQELLVEQAVATADAASRQLAAAVLGRLLGSAPALAGLSALEALGPWRVLLAPLPTPLELLNRVSPWVQPNEDDLQTLATARGVVDIIQRSPSPLPGPPAGPELTRLAEELRPLLPELLPGVARTGELFARQLVRRVALRVAADMQTTREEGVLDP
ncbi:hypothetical protein N2152v2_007442 [Parachlorella kessleri]